MKTHILHFYDFIKNPAETRNKSIQLRWFRLAEIALIFDSDYLIRHHLANDDRSHNWVEHWTHWTHSKLPRDAICDGSSLEWEYQDEFDGLMEHEMQETTFEELERHELKTNKIQCFQSRQWIHK